MSAPSQLNWSGIGLRAPHFDEFLTRKPPIAFVEVHSENYFGEGGKSLYFLEKVRNHYPVNLHGVSLSIGGSDPFDLRYLKQLKVLVDHIEPRSISDHLSWSGNNGIFLPDLLPLPYTEEALQHVISRIQFVQDYLQRTLLIENISSYITYTQSTFCESEFLNEVAKQSGCGILLDISNVYINAYNLKFDPQAYLLSLSKTWVKEFHLAGFSKQEIDQKTVLIDSHNQPIAAEIWDLFRVAIKQFGNHPTLIEWDNDLPSLMILCQEAYKAESFIDDQHGFITITN